MSAVDTAGNALEHVTVASAPRLDEVWGPVGRRSGMVVAGFVLLLLSVGMLLLDVAAR